MSFNKVGELFRGTTNLGGVDNLWCFFTIYTAKFCTIFGNLTDLLSRPASQSVEFKHYYDLMRRWLLLEINVFVGFGISEVEWSL